MKFKIRKLKLNETAQVYNLVNTALKKDFKMWPKKVNDVYRKQIYNEKHFRKFFTKKKNPIFGIYDNELLMGIIAIKSEYGGVAYIDWLVVHKRYRKLGLGTKLLKVAEKWLIKNKFHYVYFHTNSQKNIEFYKKRGFELLGSQKKSWYGVDVYLMQKVLRGKPFEEIFKKV